MGGAMVLTEDEALELVAFLVTAARTQVDEAAEYGSLRLLTAARKLADAIVARGLAINQRDEANVAPPELRRIMTVVDPPTLPSSPAAPQLSVNLSVGFALGVLAAGVFVSVRNVLRHQ